MEKKGNIKISSENMMPIIKKWLYSDKDIFIREIIANATDAITKYTKLIELGEATSADEEYCVKVTVDKKAKTLTVSDNGIGMTADEVEKYITQIAFSGASDFIEKYEKAGDGIIGHFGLGFYSAYMVSEKIDVITKSYTDAPAVAWSSDGERTYTIIDSDKQERGTDVVMHISAKEKEFLDESNIQRLIKKYCMFMPYNIYVNYVGKDDKALNNTSPLYLKNPKDCTKDEYLEFYKATFDDYNEPLFQIHLNMDYPFRLKGILYFPKVKSKIELVNGKVKLFCNQVFIADNIREVIPEFLLLLNGVIDCPDIPLNVSRSFLQNDSQVQKISKHITKKVSDLLNKMYKSEREEYEKYWDDIANFVKYGCMKDESFYDKVKNVILYKDVEGKYVSLSEFVGAKTNDDKTDEDEESKKADEAKPEDLKTYYYASDVNLQAQYLKLYKSAQKDVIICDSFIDSHFLSYFEYRMKCKFARVDSEICADLKNEPERDDKQDEKLIFAFKQALINKEVPIKVENLKCEDVPALINSYEFTRRYNEMSGQTNVNTLEDRLLTMVLNINNKLISQFEQYSEEKQKLIANQIFYLAMMSYRSLTPEEMQNFIDNSQNLLINYK